MEKSGEYWGGWGWSLAWEVARMHRRAPPLGGCAGNASSQLPNYLPMCFMLMRARALVWARSVEFGSWASMLVNRFHVGRWLGGCRRDLHVESRSPLETLLRPHCIPTLAAILVVISRICSKAHFRGLCYMFVFKVVERGCKGSMAT